MPRTGCNNDWCYNLAVDNKYNILYLHYTRLLGMWKKKRIVLYDDSMSMCFWGGGGSFFLFPLSIFIFTCSSSCMEAASGSPSAIRATIVIKSIFVLKF